MPKVIGVKLTDEQLKRFESASRRAHAKSVASWLRMLGQRATTPKAIREAEAAQSVAAADAPHIPSVAEVAKSIAGVTVGLSRLDTLMGTAPIKPEIFGKVNDDGSGQVFRRREDGTIDRIGEYKVVDGTTRPWSEEIAKLRKMEPDEARDKFMELLNGTKLPSGWKEWNDHKRATWLDEHVPLTTEEY